LGIFTSLVCWKCVFEVYAICEPLRGLCAKVSLEPLAKVPKRAILKPEALQKKWWWVAISGMIVIAK
jgi:hypothetical protein